ncbi:MAG TPA: lysophospholipid acyltransferase family protein [Gemmatimonadaceae bacterium]|nr:lysophospholipid acyltransferase family protein [Gemmatimonadaceae bacterium]
MPAGARLSSGDALPRISPQLLRWFTWYSRRYVKRHFHSLRVSRSGPPPCAHGLPLVIYSNHASWWDPLVGLVVTSAFFADRTLFAPIDAAMLARYKMLGNLGFFGVARDRAQGAIQFLRTAQAILESPQHLLAITPQGRFADVRERPARLEGGLGHLATRVGRALFVPLVAEYVFWDERLPEILLRFGEPVEIHNNVGSRVTPSGRTREFEYNLEAAQDALSAEARRRDPAAFRSLLIGGAGQGGVYDWFRAGKAKLRGEAFTREHGRA